MPLTRVVGAIIGRRGTVLYECRRCGATLDTDECTCPHCGQVDVVEIEIPD